MENKNEKIILDLSKLKKIVFDNNYLNLSLKNLRSYDLSKLSFDEIHLEDQDLSYTNANIDPSKVYNKNISNTNLEGIDLSKKSFIDVDIRYANLKHTNANLDPQLVFMKSLYETNLEGLDLSNKSFIDVDIRGANLENTNANIDPSKVLNKDLYKSNLKGLNLEGKSFEDTNIFLTNLENTHATVKTTDLKWECNISNENFPQELMDLKLTADQKFLIYYEYLLKNNLAKYLDGITIIGANGKVIIEDNYDEEEKVKKPKKI